MSSWLGTAEMATQIQIDRLLGFLCVYAAELSWGNPYSQRRHGTLGNNAPDFQYLGKLFTRRASSIEHHRRRLEGTEENSFVHDNYL